MDTVGLRDFNRFWQNCKVFTILQRRIWSMAFRQCVAVILFVFIVNSALIPREICTVYNSTGDVYIGGIFSLHGDGPEEQKCGELLPVSALQLTEAMVFAVNTVNKDDTLLPGITLGFIIHDDCSRSEYAMWGSLSLVMGADHTLDGSQCIIPGQRVRKINEIAMGVVGTETTSSSEVVISTAGLFKTPHVTYGATGQELYEEHFNPYFFGTIAPDVYTASAIIDLLVHFDWEYVALVYSSEQSVLDLEHEVSFEAQKFNICMIITAMVSKNPKETELDNMVTTLRLNPKASVVVLLSNSAATTYAVMAAAKMAQLDHSLTWVTGDSFSLNQDFVSWQGVLVVEYLKPKLEDFENYFRSLADSNNNPWYGEFCAGGTDDCQNSSEVGFSMYNVMLAPTMDAVFSLARALNRTFDNYCDVPLADCLYQIGIREAVLENLKQTSFYGTRGYFKFTENSATGQFIISNLQYTDGRLSLVEVGSWNSSFVEAERLHVNETLIQWDTGGSMVPKSACREDCKPGYVVEKNLVKQCCWGCRACREGDIVNGTKCIPCKQKEWPNADFTACDQLIAKTVTFDQPLVMILVSLTAIALLLCGLTSCGMVKHRHHALIKASSRELSVVNIAGVMMSLVAIFPFLSGPNANICGVAQSLYALSFTLVYAPLLLKVNRIYRIFESSNKTVKRPRFTGSTAQLVIVALLVITQPIVMVITALAVPGTWVSTVDLFPKPLPNHPRTLEVFCDVSVGFLTAMCYNFLLLLVCCYFAYKARNVPGNFNEARFYVASVYTTLVPIVAALPLYLTADKAVVLAFSVGLVPVINSYVTLACIYLSKLYAIKFGYQEPSSTVDRSNPGTASLNSRFLKGGASMNFAKVHPSTSKEAGGGASSTHTEVVQCG